MKIVWKTIESFLFCRFLPNTFLCASKTVSLSHTITNYQELRYMAPDDALKTRFHQLHYSIGNSSVRHFATTRKCLEQEGCSDSIKSIK